MFPIFLHTDEDRDEFEVHSGSASGSALVSVNGDLAYLTPRDVRLLRDALSEFIADEPAPLKPGTIHAFPEPAAPTVNISLSLDDDTMARLISDAFQAGRSLG